MSCSLHKLIEEFQRLKRTDCELVGLADFVASSSGLGQTLQTSDLAAVEVERRRESLASP